MTKPGSIPPHPSRGYAIVCCLFGVGALGCAALQLASEPGSSTLSALVFASFGAIVLGVGSHTLRAGSAAQRCHRALDLLGRGRVDEAEAQLDAIPERSLRGELARAAAVYRGAIAMRRGDMKAAAKHATRALAVPASLFNAQVAGVMNSSARSLRALALASSDEADAALADVAAVRGAVEALPEALARAALAEAVVHARRGDHVALSERLAAEKRLLLEFCTPRERGLVRALQRMARARPIAAYREPSPPRPAGEPPLASWIASVAPAAAPFADSWSAAAERSEAVGVEGAPTAAAVKAVEASHANSARTAGSRLRRYSFFGLWAFLLVMFFTLYQVFIGPDAPTPSGPLSQPPPMPVSRPPENDVMLQLAPLLLGLGLGALTMGVVFLWTRGLNRKFLAAMRLTTRPDPREAKRALLDLVGSRAELVAAQAGLQLAYLAERRGDFAEALGRCDAAIGRLTVKAALRVAASDILLPSLFAQRAFLLAALDRHDEATAELAALSSGFPSFPLLSRSQLRVRLVQAARRGETDKAARLAAERTPDMPLHHRDEVLADALTITAETGAAPEGEAERLRDEIRGDDELRAWLDRVAPGLSDAVERAARTRAHERPVGAPQPTEKTPAAPA